jgi:hypothetical protein
MTKQEELDEAIVKAITKIANHMWKEKGYVVTLPESHVRAVLEALVWFVDTNSKIREV